MGPPPTHLVENESKSERDQISQSSKSEISQKRRKVEAHEKEQAEQNQINSFVSEEVKNNVQVEQK